MRGYTSVNALTVLCSTCASTVVLFCTYMYMQLPCCFDIHVLSYVSQCIMCSACTFAMRGIFAMYI